MSIEGTSSRATGAIARSLSARTWTGRLVAIPLCVVALAIHVSFGHEDYSLLARFQAGALCCLALLSTGFAPVRVMPAVAIGAGFMYLALGQPIFARAIASSTRGPVRLPVRALEDATLAGLVYTLFAIAVALIVDRMLRRTTWSLTHRLDGGGVYGAADTTVARSFAALAILGRTAALAGVPLGSMAQPIGLLTSPLIMLTFLFWDAEHTQRPAARTILWLAAGYLAFLGMLSGMLQELLAPGVIMASLMWAHRAKLPVTMIGISAAILIFLTPAKHVYRELAWYQNKPTMLEKIALWGTAIERTYLDDRSHADASSSLERTTSRFSTVAQVAQIFDSVPARIPFAGPERWFGLMQLAVPRVLWPQKPILDQYYNRNYTHIFHLQNRASAGSITLPSVGDGYWRLGWPGIFIEAGIFGFFMGAAQGVSRGGSRSALLLAGALLQLRPDGHIFGAIIGTLQQTLLAFAVIVLAKFFADLLAADPATPNTEPSGATRRVSVRWNQS